MLPFFWYMLKVIICSGVLFGYYWLFLRNKIFHQYNRFYLLAAMSLSLLLPLLKINFWQPDAEKNQAIRVLQAFSTGDEYMNSMVITAHKSSFTLEQFYPIIYWLVSFIFFIVMLRTILLIRTLLKKYPAQQVEAITFINTEDESTPFSFLKYIFWNNNIDMGTTTGRQIFKHEVAHIQEKHTHDKLFVSMVLIFCWCNPFFWLYRKELNMIHEFIADKKAVEDSDTSAFAAMILQAAYPKHQFELVNNFFYSPIKRRLMMLTKNTKTNYIGRILVLPLAVLVFAAFTLKKQKIQDRAVYQGKKITVIINPAYGGNVLGWKSATGVYEKDINLAIAKEIKSLNNNDNIEIILTRDKDINALSECRNIVAKNNASLFITISLAQNTNNNKERGWYICIPHNSDKYYQQSKILGSILVNSFSGNYGLPASENALLERAWVMTFTECPSIMVQPGHITNSEDFNYFNTASNQKKIAENILTGIKKYLINKSSVQFPQLNNTDTLPKKLSPSTTPVTVNGKKVKKASVIKEGILLVEYEDGTAYKMTQDEATKAGINMESNMLYVVDGKITNKDKAGLIRTETIEAVNILKGEAALKKYGIEGKDGVIEIKRKVLLSNFSLNATDLTLSADNATIRDGNNALTLSGNVNISGDLSNSIVYVDGKIVTENELKAIDVSRIDVVNIEATKETDKKIIFVSLKKTAEPNIYIGRSSGGRIASNYLKAQDIITVTSGYSFVSAAIYFSGPDFKLVKVYQINSNSLGSIQESIEKCRAGDVLVFDNVWVKDDNGNKIMISAPPAFQVLEELTETTEISKTAFSPENKIFTTTENPPQFTGGPEAFRKYLRENLKTNTPVNNGAKAGIYKVVLKFIVNADGSLSDIKCENDPGFGIGAEAIRFIKTTPKWQPAVQNGKKVNAYLKQPITFVVEEEDAKPVTTSLYKSSYTKTIDQLFAFDPQYKKDIKVPSCVGLDFYATYTGKIPGNLKNR